MYIWNSRDLSTVLKQPTDLFGNAIIMNSRDIKQGDIFIAFDNGAEHDGHAYVKNAIEAGACACIVNKNSRYDLSQYKNYIIQVADTHISLLDMAKYKRKHTKATILAVTGSSGKTTTKNLIYDLVIKQVELQSFVFATYKNFNNFLGTCLNLASIHPQCKHMILEMGMERFGELDEIARLVKPHISVITNISYAHAENFASLQETADAKAEIFYHTKKNGTAILNADDSQFTYLAKKAQDCNLKVLTYGKDISSDLVIHDIQVNSNNVYVDFKFNNKKYNAASNFYSLGNIQNIACGLLSAQVLGFEVASSVKFTGTLFPYQGRGNRIDLADNCTLIDCSYNANYGSVSNNLEIFKYFKSRQRKVLILADMKGMGKQAVMLHEKLYSVVINCGIDKVITVGSLAKVLYNKLPIGMKLVHCDNVTQLLPKLKNLIKKQDFILVQGSRVMQMEKVVHNLQSNCPQ